MTPTEDRFCPVQPGTLPRRSSHWRHSGLAPSSGPRPKRSTKALEWGVARPASARHSSSARFASTTLCNCAGPIAQRLEQRTHNPLVPGSNPGGPTKKLALRLHPGAFFVPPGNVSACTVVSLARRDSHSLRRLPVRVQDAGQGARAEDHPGGSCAAYTGRCSEDGRLQCPRGASAGGDRVSPSTRRTARPCRIGIRVAGERSAPNLQALHDPGHDRRERGS